MAFVKEILLVVAVVQLSGVTLGLADSSNEKSLINIHVQLGRFCQLYANHNADELSQLFTEDATFTRVSRPGNFTLHGRRAIRNYFNDYVFSVGPGQMYTNPQQLVLNSSSNGAQSSSTFYFDQAFKVSGVMGKGSSQQTWSRQGKEWLLAAETVHVEEVFIHDTTVAQMNRHVCTEHKKIIGYLYPAREHLCKEKDADF